MYSWNVEELQRNLPNTETLKNVVEFLSRNRLNLNVSQTKFVAYHWRQTKFDYEYTVNGEVIEDLGLKLDKNLNHDEHIEYIIANLLLLS